MTLPIIAYGDPVLKKKASEVDKNQSGIRELIENMFETMYKAEGVGLAAPQVGQSLRIFVVDTTPFKKDDEKLDGFKKVFINPEIIESTGKEILFNEGCLSFPNIREDIWRKPEVFIRYYDEDFNLHEEKYDGIAARILQHEYDHIEGIVFIDRISPLKRRIIKGKLNSIAKGLVDVNYRMKFPARKQKSYS